MELDGLWPEILVRLTAEELGRCKVVCKEWCNLISSPYFVSKHLIRSQLDPSRHLILFHDSEPPPRRSKREEDSPPPPPPGPFKSVVCFSSLSLFVVGSVNGLICIAGNYRDRVTSPDDIWILNPVTTLSIKLPPPASPTVEDRDEVSLAFSGCCDSEEDSKEIISYKVFKIVWENQLCDLNPHHPDSLWPCLCRSGGGIITARPIVSNRVEVWDSRYPEKWTEIKNVDFRRPFYHPRGWTTSCDIVVESSAYWIVADAKGFDLLLLSIDMKTHAVKLIPLPEELSTPGDVLIGKLVSPFSNSFLFCAIWEGRFALVERHDSQTMLYNVWALKNYSGTSWIKKTTFSLDFGVRRCINCVHGKLLLLRDDLLKIMYDMKTQQGKVLGETKRILFTREEEELATVNSRFHWSFFNSKLSFEQFQTLFGKNDMRNREVVVDEFGKTCVFSAHHFVGTLVSIEGFKPIRSFANCPRFTLFWPNLAAFASKVPSSTSSVNMSPVIVPPSSANVPSGVKPATSVNVYPAAAKASVPIGAPASNEAPKITYASLVAKWTPVNFPRAAPKALYVPLADGASLCNQSQ